MDKIKITLETLYDILRNEKKKEDLQKLEPTFFIDVVSYIREKKALLDTKQSKDELFSVGEKEKLEYELRSIKRILKEIYEKREKKILDIALNKSRTGSDIIDTSAMLREEKSFYEKVLRVFDLQRKGVVSNLFQGELPDVPEEGRQRVGVGIEQKPFVEVKKEVPPALAKFEAVKKEEQKSATEAAEKSTVVLTKIKFTHPLPSFVWKNMKVYGPFDTGEETEIFPEVADLIVRKGRAVKV